MVSEQIIHAWGLDLIEQRFSGVLFIMLHKVEICPGLTAVAKICQQISISILVKNN